MKFKMLKCAICGQEVIVTNETGVPIVCCGLEMQEVIPNTTDGASEKHVPVCEENPNGCTVKIGTSKHPMTPEHYIDWIMIETTRGKSGVRLNPGEEPQWHFEIAPGDQIKNIYCHCNIHGLWMK